MKDAYIQDHFTVLRSQADAVNNILTGQTPDNVHLIKHVLQWQVMRRTGQQHPRHDGFVPIPWNALQKYLRKSDWRAATDFLDVTCYSRNDHRCRTARAKSFLVEAFQRPRAGLSDEVFLTEPKVDFYTGRSVKTRPRISRYDLNHHPHPDLMVQAIEAFNANGCPYNRLAWGRQVATLKEELDHHHHDTPDYRTALARYVTQQTVYDGILGLTSRFDGEVSWFDPVYYGISTGRLTHYRGGLQNASRAGKAAAYFGIHGLRNYDLVNSHPWLLVQILEDVGLNAQSMIDYLQTGRARYAERMGIPESLLKVFVLMLMNGATVPKSNRVLTHSRQHSMIRAALKAYGGDEEQARIAIQGFTEVFRPILAQLKSWHNHLLTTWIPANVQTRGRGGKTVANACEKKYTIEADMPRHRIKSTLAAHLLQGLESRLIHTLTLLGPKYGFTPCGNEHDGLITLGEIPDEALDEAKILANVRNAWLIEKPWIVQAGHARGAAV